LNPSAPAAVEPNSQAKKHDAFLRIPTFRVGSCPDNESTRLLRGGQASISRQRVGLRDPARPKEKSPFTKGDETRTSGNPGIH